MTANLKAVTPNDGSLRVLTTEELDDSSIKVEQIRGLCEMMLEHTAEHRGGTFSVEMDNCLLTGCNLISRLAGEVSEVLDKAPGVRSLTKADAAK